MSQTPTLSRPPQRRRKASGLITNGVMALILIVGCVYAIWGVRPLRQAWTALGFGKQMNGQSAVHIKSPDAAQQRSVEWGGQDSKSKVPPPPVPLSNLPPSSSEAETEVNPFLAKQRARPNLNLRRPATLGPNSTEAELDRRFELESPQSPDSNSIRTADFEEPADPEHRQHKHHPHKKIQFELDPGIVSEEPVIVGDDGEEVPESKQVRQIGGQQDRRAKPAAVKPQAGVKATPASAIAPSGSLKLPEVQQLIEAGRDAEAYQLLATAYTQNASDRPRFQELLDKVAQRIYFTPQPQMEPPHEIQPGDQLRKIASKYHMSWQYLSKLNQVDARKIRPGKKLKVFQGPFSATVDLSDFELVIFLSGKYVKRYSVGTGKDNTSPIGEFTVKEKLENPTYYGPEGNVMAADDPKNPLGERWIDIGNSFGIHGTIEPDSIGKSESAGCIRMRNDDVAEVYDLLTVGSTVVIQR